MLVTHNKVTVGCCPADSTLYCGQNLPQGSSVMTSMLSAEVDSQKAGGMEERVRAGMGKMYDAGDSWAGLALWANQSRREGPPEAQVTPPPPPPLFLPFDPSVCASAPVFKHADS